MSISSLCILTRNFVGNVYIADSDNGVVRKLTVSTGIITTIAGSGDVFGADGDGDQATSASFFNLGGIALDA